MSCELLEDGLMAEPKYAVGDSVRIVADCWSVELRGLVGAIVDPSREFAGKLPGWGERCWKLETGERGREFPVYWVEFPCHPPAGSKSMSGAEVAEDWIERV